MPYVGVTGQGMPPYSTDPNLSLSRYQDPNYVNSSDPPPQISSDMSIECPIPSSPPTELKLDDFPSWSARRVESYDQARIYDANELDYDENADHTIGEILDDELTDDDNDVTMTQDTSHSHSFSIFGIPKMDPFLASSAHDQYPKFAGAESTMRTRSIQSLEAFPAGHTYSGPCMIASRTDSKQQRRTAHEIERVFDGESSAVNLDNGGYKEIPEECRSLIDHEDLGRRLLRVSISGNSISVVDRFLYQIDRLSYLNLRQNNITELTSMIKCLVNLTELHLGHNCLQALPAEMLSMPKLTTVTIYPNDFLPVPKNGPLEHTIRHETPPSLSELCHRAIASAGMIHPYTEFKKMLYAAGVRVPKQLLEPSLRSIRSGRACSTCSQPLIQPVASQLQWMRHPAILSRELTPFQRFFCSDLCLNHFLDHSQVA